MCCLAHIDSRKSKNIIDELAMVQPKIFFESSMLKSTEIT